MGHTSIYITIPIVFNSDKSTIKIKGVKKKKTVLSIFLLAGCYLNKTRTYTAKTDV